MKCPGVPRVVYLAADRETGNATWQRLRDEGCPRDCWDHTVEHWLLDLPWRAGTQETRWGAWVLDPRSNTLQLHGHGPWHEVNLDRCTSSVAVLQEIVRAAFDDSAGPVIFDDSGRVEPNMLKTDPQAVRDLIYALYDRLPMPLFRPAMAEAPAAEDVKRTRTPRRASQRGTRA